MSAYKQFTPGDAIITPFTANKQFNLEGAAAITGSGIDRYYGENNNNLNFIPAAESTTGDNTIRYKKSIYDSLKHLYYSNFLSSSYGDNVTTSSLILGVPGTNSDVITGNYQGPTRYNYPQTTLSYPKYFPTASDAVIGLISIPSTLFGEFIQPESFIYTANGVTLTDDGEGNLLSGSDIVGNIIYPHGLIIFTGNSTDTYLSLIDDIVTNSNVTCSFKSSYRILETQYRCVIRENEFNLSLNPSLISGSAPLSGSEHRIYDFATGSLFAPFITTVGLYDDNNNLIAVGKLSQPLECSPTTDTVIYVNIDR